VAPPAVAVPCQVIGADPSVIVPEFGLAACTVGDVMGAVLTAARMQNNKNRTPSEPAVRVVPILDNHEGTFLRGHRSSLGLRAFCAFVFISV
jgi:hypothetical protein